MAPTSCGPGRPPPLPGDGSGGGWRQRWRSTANPLLVVQRWTILLLVTTILAIDLHAVKAEKTKACKYLHLLS